MPIYIRNPSGQITAQAAEFTSESELEDVVSSKPELLGLPDERPMALVGRQVDMADAGTLDLLFVDDAGLPVAVEVKLAKNGESRRQVHAADRAARAAIRHPPPDLEIHRRPPGQVQRLAGRRALIASGSPSGT